MGGEKHGAGTGHASPLPLGANCWQRLKLIRDGRQGERPRDKALKLAGLVTGWRLGKTRI